MTLPDWSSSDFIVAQPTLDLWADYYGVDRTLVYAVASQESRFKPNAIRQEPTYHCRRTGVTGDASYGLMQVLYCTALGLGFGGQPTDLLDPNTSAQYGVMLLSQLLRQYGDEWDALSAYNSGKAYTASLLGAAYADQVEQRAQWFRAQLASPAPTDTSGTTDTIMDNTSPGGLSGGDVAGLLVLAGAIAAAAWMLR